MSVTADEVCVARPVLITLGSEAKTGLKLAGECVDLTPRLLLNFEVLNFAPVIALRALKETVILNRYIAERKRKENQNDISTTKHSKVR